MGRPRPFSEMACLIIGLLFRDPDIYEMTVSQLQTEYGLVLFESPRIPWDHSVYYVDEIGEGIQRTFICFEDLISPERIVDIKLRTNEIEAALSREGKRAINIDPGYITPSKVVLASTKNYSHRIYLGRGIYAEITLYYHKGEYHSLPFTYHDYTKSENIRFFRKVREHLKTARRED